MILLIIAISISIILVPFGFAFGIISNIADLKNYFTKIAVSIDQTGNVVCAALFNATLKTKYGYKFGNCDETISSVLGKNYRDKTLTKTGLILCFILNKLDNNHVIKSIEENP